MVLRMKNFNIFGVHWKIRLLRVVVGRGGGGGSRKTNIEGGLPKKGERLGQFPDLSGGLARKRGWWFWGGVDTPLHTMYRNQSFGGFLYGGNFGA